MISDEGTSSSTDLLESILLAPISDNLCVQQIIKASVLMAVSGWCPVSSTTTTGVLPLIKKGTKFQETNISQCKDKDKETIQSEAIATPKHSIDSFRCEQCGRCIPFRYLSSTAAMNPLNQHRSFCLWASDPEIEGSGSTPGWLQCSRAVMSDKQATVDLYSGVCLGGDLKEASLSRRSSRGEDPLSPVTGTGAGIGGDTVIDAEHAYKKIKLVLDFSALPRVTQKNV
eukprot:CAMPEP_0119053456 /NCGR_PEP_ID=MMETSP1177-20130426/74440_1 /TAXON_ID=2985 /ORGANISM="Ochromonas sp, Strain CCMP1899" /LENGTH=227 /DNA_ID=CAMNT_0007033413 /DNA_START=780 /DNA_END=1463 /DNA_ORIENTATION=+